MDAQIKKARSVRRVVAQDKPAIAAIAEATELFPGHMLDDMIAGYLDRSKSDIWLAAVESGQVTGFAFCEPERMTTGTWNLLAIAVSPEAQSKGIGKNLIQHLEGELKSIGQRLLLVETIGTDDFARTRAFYGREGFHEEARLREFYDAGLDKVVYCKAL